MQAASSQIQRLLCDASGHALEDASLVKSLLPLAASAAKLQVGVAALRLVGANQKLHR